MLWQKPVRLTRGDVTYTIIADPRLKPGQEIWIDMPEKPIATWYSLDRDVGRTVFRRTDSAPADLPPGKSYAIFALEPGDVTELGSREVVVRAWSDDDPLSVAEFFAALQAAKNTAATATQRLEDWFAQACPKCREMVVSHAAGPQKGAPREKQPKKISGSRPKKSGAVRRTAG